MTLFKTYKTEQTFCSINCYRNNQKRSNRITEYDNYAIIEINSQKNGYINLKIDLDDVWRICKYTWCIIPDGNRFYAMTRINGKTVKLHRFILGYKNKKIIDHINRNTLDNRKDNLRFCNHSENTYNTSTVTGGIKHKYIGVKNAKGYYPIIIRDRHNKGKYALCRYSKSLSDAIIIRNNFFKGNPQYTLIE